ncbi:hypothetical protein Cni_G27749 [Canna indica]|uniref:DYW domain-containing protein n=1 Tax=Canna indica TaxID=4628 RepID=A0AAQ3L4C4_9LILI|nr:hypothetical protein Cni_G27749 [Canna indica]
MAAEAHLNWLLARCTTFAHIKQFHAHLLTTGLFRRSAPLRIALVELCALSPFGDLAHALAAFRSTPHSATTTNDWNAAIRGIAAGPDPSGALGLFARMLALSPPRPDALTLSFVVRAAARSSALPATLQLHALALRLGLGADVRLITTLLDAYAKCSSPDSALQLFDEMPLRDIATWNALLAGLALCPHPHTALTLFRRMISSSLPDRESPNEITIIAAASACAQLCSARDVDAVHDFAQQRGLDADVRVRNALVDAYAKCGALDRALHIFRSIPSKTLVSWNAALMALAMHGHGALALRLFESEMLPSHIAPDAVTYLAILCGCVHAGLVEDGLRVFRSMRDVRPTAKHYGAVVDLLGRAGRLAEARALVDAMPFAPDRVLWQTLLGAARSHGDVALAEHAARQLADMGSNACGDYVLLSNVYAAKARWNDVGRIRDAMQGNDVRKVPGFSYTEVGGELHRFLNGDKEHEQWREIYRTLEEAEARIRALGHVPETENVLHDIEEEDKERAVYQHSEKLAMAFGLVATPAGSPIQVVKNLRICGDCHAVAKLISRAYGRVITVRDRARFHRFEGGECSCGDYW